MGVQTQGDVLGAIEAHRSELGQLGIKQLGRTRGPRPTRRN